MRLRVTTEPQQGSTYDQLLAVARCAEEEGYDAFFRSDHYLKMGGVDGLPGPTDAWTTLAGLARDTGRVRLGTLVSAAGFNKFLLFYIIIIMTLCRTIYAVNSE